MSFDSQYPCAPLRCPQCGIRGTVRTERGFRVEVRHECPGPWTLEAVVPVVRGAPWRATFVNVPLRLFGRPGEFGEAVHR